MNVIAILNHMGVYFKEEPIRELHRALERLNFQIVYPNDRDDLLKLIENNARLCGVIFDWDKYNLELCEEISKMNENLPLYAFANTYSTLDVSLNDLRLQISFFEYALGAADDIANKIKQTTDEYINTILPPLTKALFKYVREGKYTFCTPGHMGGTAFQKSPVGSLFYDFFGPNTMKSDISISVSELGSLLDHSGPHKEAEQYIARVFNADRSYMVTNGTSTANKIVGMYSAPAGSTILIDRNCHKSLTHLMMMSDVTPIYFRPTRNAYGILGGIPQSEFQHATIAKRVKETPNATWPVHAVITNSTYDGLLYNTDFIKKTLDVKSIHFDSAWVPYTNFSPIYEGKCGMSGGRVEGKVIYETQSTHKLLAAFSQASMIHVKGDVNEETFNEAVAELDALEEKLAQLEFRRMFSGEYDSADCYLDIQAGSGGTEAQDWASMLERMYLRWAESRGFKTEIIEESEGEVAGIKSVTIKISGDYAYGWLRTETGVHRLVRKSPFDSGGRRHTSFSSAFVYPEVDDDIDIEINPADLRIDVYRASGAGGQHVNRTESAVRITHIPTGIVTQCQNDRSQHKNKDQAMKLMKAKLYELEMQKKNAEKQAMEDNNSDIGWGSQIRSYVLDDSRIKDLRTGVETRNTQAVLDGSLDQFIEASLKAGL